MKQHLLISLGMTLVLTALSSQAATETQSMADRTVIGHVSAGGASNLSELTHALKKEADKSGASEFYITSAGGTNKLRGTAVLLK